VAPLSAPAQTGGLQVDITVNSSVKADSNFSLTPGKSKGSTGIFDNRLTFGLSSITSAYTLNVGLSTDLRFAHIPGRSVNGLEDPTARVNFIADSADSRLTINGRYRNVNRDFLNPFQVEREEQQFGTLVGNGGTLRDQALGLKYESGLNDPLGFILDGSHDKKAYSGVVNPLIFDNTTDSARGTVTMRVSPVTQFRTSAGIKHYTADDLPQTNRRTTDYAVGVVQEINPTLLLDAQIGYSSVKTDTIFGTATRSGLTNAVSLTQTVANGTVFGTLATTRNQNGARTNLTFGRDLQLPNGSLRAAFGLTRGSVGSSAFIGSVAYTHQIASDDITLSFDRAASTNVLNQDVLDTRFAINYGHAINNISRLDVTFDWGQTQGTGRSGAQTIALTDLTATYSRDLTSDWTMTGGMTLRQRTQTGLASAKSTAVFLTLGRNFSFRP